MRSESLSWRSERFTATLIGRRPRSRQRRKAPQTSSSSQSEPTREAEEGWLELVTAPNAMTDYLKACTPGYYNAEGNARSNNDGFLQGHYPEGGLRFYEMLAEWRAAGNYEGMAVG